MDPVQLYRIKKSRIRARNSPQLSNPKVLTLTPKNLYETHFSTQKINNDEEDLSKKCMAGYGAINSVGELGGIDFGHFSSLNYTFLR